MLFRHSQPFGRERFIMLKMKVVYLKFLLWGYLTELCLCMLQIFSQFPWICQDPGQTLRAYCIFCAELIAPKLLNLEAHHNSVSHQEALKSNGIQTIQVTHAIKFTTTCLSIASLVQSLLGGQTSANQGPDSTFVDEANSTRWSPKPRQSRVKKLMVRTRVIAIWDPVNSYLS